MQHSSLDLVVIVGLVLLNFATSLLAQASGFAGDSALRSLVGVPLVLLAPGYAIVAAIWPARRLPRAERLVLSLGISLALAALTGLVLNFLGPGLRPVPWAVALGGPTLLASTLALYERQHPRATVAIDAKTDRIGRSFGPSAWLITAAAALVTLGAVGVATSGAAQQREGFSELWLVPAPDASGGDRLQVGLRSMELQPSRFHVQVLEGERVALDEPDIQLSNRQAWQTSILVSDELAAGSSIEAVVYRADAPQTPYRRVELRPTQKG